MKNPKRKPKKSQMVKKAKNPLQKKRNIKSLSPNKKAINKNKKKPTYINKPKEQ